MRYPLDSEPFGRANRAIARVAEEEEVPLIDARAAVFRLPPEERLWLRGRHPNGAMYREVAREIVSVLASLEPGGTPVEAPPPPPAS